MTDPIATAIALGTACFVVLDVVAGVSFAQRERRPRAAEGDESSPLRGRNPDDPGRD